MSKINIFLLVSILFVLLISASFAQQADGSITGTPWRGEDGITVSVQKLIDLEKSTPKLPFSPRIREENETDRELKANPNAPAVSSWPPISEQTQDQTAVAFTPQTVGTNWLGIQVSETVGYYPPDIMGDVGPTQVLMHVNGYIKVFDKAGTVGGLSVSDLTFWSTVRNGQDVSDPHVRYDPISKRWFVVIINLASSKNRILIAVSSGPTITNTSSFTFYQFTYDAVGTPGTQGSGFLDYPTLGVDANALYIGGNVFNAAGTSFLGSCAYVVRKSALLTGTLTVTGFYSLNNGTGAGPYTPQGVQNDDSTATEGYFIGTDNATYSQLDIRRITNPGGTPTISGNIIVTVPTTVPPMSTGQTVKGSTSSRTLDDLEDRLFAAMIKKNKLTGVTSLWTAHNIEVNSSGVGTTGGGRNASRWYEITNLTTTPTLRQSGTVYSSAATPIGYWIPSVAMSGQGHMALGCSYASANDYASIAVAGRLGTDVLGTTQSPTNAVVSSSAYNDPFTGTQRWGDFTQTVVDPTDDMTMWTFQEYANTTNSWGIRAIKLIAPPPATPSSISPTSLNTGVSNASLTVTGTSTTGSGFFDPGAGFTNRIAASVSGTGVTVNSVTFTSATSITLNVTVAANATAGTRTITVTNPDGQTATSATALLTINNVSCPTITLTPTTLPNGDKGGAYSQTITASGGVAAYTYTLTGGALPTGLSLSTGGVVSGTPTVAGTFLFTVTATDANSCTGVKQDTLTINACPTITVSPTTLTNGNAGSAYSQSITSSGGVSAYTYAVTTGTLPAGMTLTSGGVLSGTPTYGGTYTFTVTSTDAHSCTGTRAYTFVVTGCPQITVSPASLPSAISGASYNQTITTSGGKTPYTYQVTAGALPVGLSLSTGGVITGSSTALGTASFTITSTDSNLCTASKAYSITISNCPTITVSPSTLPNGTIGTAYNQTISSTGGTAAYTYSVTVGTLPTGLTLSSGGVLSGTPTVVGSSTFTVQSSDANSCTATQAYTIQVNCPTITLSPSTLSSGTVGVAYTTTITSSGGTASYTYSVISGTLPAGLSLSSAGAFSGSPTTVGSSTFTVQSSDANGCLGTQAYTLQVNALSGNFISLATSGGAYTQDFNTLPSAGTTDSTLPAGWLFRETGTSANTTYGIGAGTTNTGNTYDFGTAASSDRALGSLQSSSVNPTIGAGFVNNTGGTITSLLVSYNCEQWRMGVASRTVPDTLVFQFSQSATSLSTGTWTKYDSLNGYTTLMSGTVGGLDGNAVANRKAVSYTITGLSITTGTSFFIRWIDGNISGSDDGLAVDDFSITPYAGAVTTNPSIAVSATPDTVNAGASTLLKAIVTAGTNPASTGVTVTANLSTIGGSASQSLYDDGTNGDVTGGDNIYSYSATVSGGTTAGVKSLPFTVSDAQSRTGNATLSMLVTVQGCPIITVSPSTLPAGTIGTAYSQTVSATGGTTPYTFAVTTGTLPAGLTLASGGGLTGTPTASGSSTFTVTATDSNGCTGNVSYTIQIACPTITVAPTSLVAGVTGSAYSQTISATGGKTPYAFTVTTGTLPTGLSLATGGNLTGTPSVVGSSTFTVTATDSNGCTGTKSYTVSITAPVSTISLTSQQTAYTQDFNTLAKSGISSVLPNGWLLYETGTSSNTLYTAGNGSGTSGDTYSFGADTSSTERALGGLQSGSVVPMWGAGFTNNTGSTITTLLVSYNGEEWRLGGARAVPDTMRFQLSFDATSISNGTWTKYDTLTFLSPVYSGTAGALDGNASANRTALSYTISGLSIANGATFFIRWQDGNPTSADEGLAVDDFSLTPNAVPVPTNPSMTVSATPDTVVKGGTTLLKATVTPGTLPTSTGLTVTADLSTIGGSASQAFYDDGTNGDVTGGDNVFSFSTAVTAGTSAGLKSLPFTVSDAQSRTGNASLSLLVTVPGCPTITVAPSTLPNGSTGTSYNQTISASGGTTPYTFTVTVGTVPTGLTLATNGTLSGTPSVAGSSSFTVTATDSNGCTGTQAYTISVTSPISTINLATSGTAYTQDFNTLAMTGTSSVLPSGWYLYETGTAQNSLYTAGNGTGTSGDTYSFGNDSTSSERALGELQSGSLIPSIGAGFTNNTGAAITSLIVSYMGEEWRGGATTRTTSDTIAFQLSTDATGLTGGTWTPYTSLNFASPVVTTTASALDGNAAANRAQVSAILTGLNIANGATFFIRWSDVNVTGADDALAVDDFSITPYSGGATPTNPSVTGSATPDTVVTGSTTLLKATVTAGTNPSSTGLVVTGNLSSIGGSASQSFYDDGTHGDGTSSDKVFSFSATVPGNTTVGTKSISLNVTDGQSRSGSTTLSIVVAKPPCPTITVSPSTLPAGTVGTAYNQTVTATGGVGTYSFAVTSGTLPAGLTLSTGGVLSGTPSSNATANFTVTAYDSNQCSGSRAYTVTVNDAQANVTVNVQAKWNIVSNPVTVTNDSVRVLFPTATSSAFAFTASGYQTLTKLSNGTGVWLKFESASAVSITGMPILSDTIDVIAGWNIIGSVTHPVLASSITSIPGGIQTGSFFKYNNGYVTADTIIPGMGYWVKVTQAGKLILSSSNIFAANRIQITPNGEMPPAPPQASNNPVVPTEFALDQNFPNPFNPTTNFGFKVAELGMVSLRVYDVLGKEVATVVNQEMNPGSYTIQWDASGIPSGVYYYRMSSGKFSDMKKLLLMK